MHMSGSADTWIIPCFGLKQSGHMLEGSLFLKTVANNKIPCGVMRLEIFITFTNKNLEPHNQLARV